MALLRLSKLQQKTKKDTDVFLAKNSMAKKYLDIEDFKKFNVEWNDLEMCFSIWGLHNGKV